MKEEKEVINEKIKINLSDRKKHKLKKYAEKYKSHERLLIASSTRKTIRYIERNINNVNVNIKCHKNFKVKISQIYNLIMVIFFYSNFLLTTGT